MKKLLLSFCLVGTALSQQAQTVTIPDTLFRNALIANNVDSNLDSLIQTSEALAITRLKINSKGINDLTGIEAFSNLTFLRCDTNNLTSINFDGNPKIDTLWINNNKLTTLDISPLTSLVYFNCALNKLGPVNSSFNTELKWYDIGGNPNAAPLDLSKNIALTYLDIVYISSMTSIDISNNINLQTVLAQLNNNLLSLDVSMNTKLTTLGLTAFGSPKSICVNSTQMASIPSGWTKNASDKYTTTGCTVGIEEISNSNASKEIIHIYNLMGQEVSINDTTEGIFIFQYSDGSIEKRAGL